MLIVVTDRNQFSGDDLEIGKWYNAEPAATGTAAQNAAFHALVQEYWRSGCHSYNAVSFEHFRALIKLHLGAGAERFCNLVDADGNPLPGGRFDYRLKSWADYTKKERRETLDRLIAEMHQAGVNSRKFYEILRGMESGPYVGAESLAEEAVA